MTSPVDFAGTDDVEKAYDGDLPSSASDRLQYQIDVVNARLRLLMPTLEVRVAENDDLATLARDVVVQAVIRRLGPSDPAVRSVSQGVGPWSTTLTYERDRAGIFSDDDLRLLSEEGTAESNTGVGTIRLGRVDWANQ